MKNLILLMLLSFAFLSIPVHADVTYPTNANNKPAFPPMNWSAKADPIVIENSSGGSITIQISVDGNESSPGIKLDNCGETTLIKAGSSAVCTNSDAKNPVSFTSADTSETATGTYQVIAK
jgi:hypothetical protein